MSAVKASTVVTVIPAVNTAWADLCKTGKTSADTNRKAILTLGAIISKETASMTSISKSIQDTKKVSHIKGLTYATIKGITTFVALSKSKSLKADFEALPLDKAITFANKCYDLLGKGNAQKFTVWADLEMAVQNAQDEKTRKAKESRENAKGKDKDKGKSAPKTDLTATLKSIYIMVSALSESEVKDSHVEQWNEICAVFEQKYMADVDA